MVLYVVFSVARGSDADFYPYPILDPDTVGGLGGVALYGAGTLLVFAAVGWFVKWWADEWGILPSQSRS